MTKTPTNCGSCKHYDLNRQYCRRFPPQAVDNRNVRYSRTQWDDYCSEHAFRKTLKMPDSPSWREYKREITYQHNRNAAKREYRNRYPTLWTRIKNWMGSQ